MYALQPVLANTFIDFARFFRSPKQHLMEHNSLSMLVVQRSHPATVQSNYTSQLSLAPDDQSVIFYCDIYLGSSHLRSEASAYQPIDRR
jgi:hypothetical protein